MGEGRQAAYKLNTDSPLILSLLSLPNSPLQRDRTIHSFFSPVALRFSQTVLKKKMMGRILGYW